MKNNSIYNAYSILRVTLTRPIAFYRIFAKIAGSAAAGLFLSQLWYWHDKGQEEWFFKTQQEWQQETALTKQEQKTARSKLRKLGILHEKHGGLPRRLYYKLDVNKLMHYLQQFAELGDETLSQSQLADINQMGSQQQETLGNKDKGKGSTSPKTQSPSQLADTGTPKGVDNSKSSSGTSGNKKAETQSSSQLTKSIQLENKHRGAGSKAAETQSSSQLAGNSLSKVVEQKSTDTNGKSMVSEDEIPETQSPSQLADFSQQAGQNQLASRSKSAPILYTETTTETTAYIPPKSPQGDLGIYKQPNLTYCPQNPDSRFGGSRKISESPSTQSTPSLPIEEKDLPRKDLPVLTEKSTVVGQKSNLACELTYDPEEAEEKPWLLPPKGNSEVAKRSPNFDENFIDFFAQKWLKKMATLENIHEARKVVRLSLIKNPRTIRTYWESYVEETQAYTGSVAIAYGQGKEPTDEEKEYIVKHQRAISHDLANPNQELESKAKQSLKATENSQERMQPASLACSDASGKTMPLKAQEDTSEDLPKNCRILTEMLGRFGMSQTLAIRILKQNRFEEKGCRVEYRNGVAIAVYPPCQEGSESENSDQRAEKA